MPVAVDWAGVAQQVVSGLSSGGIYAMLAVALVLIYRATGVRLPVKQKHKQSN